MRAILFLLVLVSFSATAFIDWASLKNPVYQRDHWSVKDASMIYHEESATFYLFFSAFFEEDGKISSHVASVKTKDFKTFSEPLFVWSGSEVGRKGLAAPEVFRDGDRFVLTYNSWGDKFLKPNQLFFATSPDLEHWEKHRPLAKDLTRGKRAIDAAMIRYNGKYILNYKTGRLFQKSRIATSDSLSGPWTYLGRPIREWMENGELLVIGSELHLMMTGEGHFPYLSKLLSDDFLHWSTPEVLTVPAEAFNTLDRANSGHLKDWRGHDGYFYLLYAGTTEGNSYLGRGDNKLGLARSKDLVNWEVP